MIDPNEEYVVLKWDDPDDGECQTEVFSGVWADCHEFLQKEGLIQMDTILEPVMHGDTWRIPGDKSEFPTEVCSRRIWEEFRLEHYEL